MGSHDGAETCELIGTYLLSHITKLFGHNVGLYRDDGLGLVQATPRQAELLKKKLCELFKKHSLRITVDTNKRNVNYLDVNLDLHTGISAPYNKPNNKPTYVHAKSNHPPSILKNIPLSVNNRLSSISSDADVFNSNIQVYQKALEESGHQHQLKYDKPTTARNRQRKRHILWYNPPYSKNVSTNVGKTFIKTIKTEFPPSHPLHKIFNCNNLKVSYSCMPNVERIMNMHNKAISNNSTTPDPSTNTRACNCRRRDQCPLNGQCLQKGIIYQAKVIADNSSKAETYIGLTETTFKTRYNNHKSSFNLIHKKSNTELSNHVWKLKDSNINYSIEWSIVRRARPYSPAVQRCSLCNWEKYYIICHPNEASLNKRSELVSTCRHSHKYTLKSWKDAST